MPALLFLNSLNDSPDLRLLAPETLIDFFANLIVSFSGNQELVSLGLIEFEVEINQFLESWVLMPSNEFLESFANCLHFTIFFLVRVIAYIKLFEVIFDLNDTLFLFEGLFLIGKFIAM